VIVGAAGNAFTVTATWELTVLKPSFTATQYVVLTVGFAVGFASVDVNPAGTDVQLYVYIPDPPLARAASCTVDPIHIEPGVAVGEALNGPPLIVTVTSSKFEHVVVLEVAIKVNMVVDERFFVVGSSTVGFTSCDDGVQL
jgi:hypothetical protein